MATACDVRRAMCRHLKAESGERVLAHLAGRSPFAWTKGPKHLSRSLV